MDDYNISIKGLELISKHYDVAYVRFDVLKNDIK